MDYEIRLRGRKAIFCISHIQPFFRLPNDVNLVQTAAFNTEAHAILVDPYVHLRTPGTPLGFTVDYAQAFLAEILAQCRDRVDHVVIILHRKITVPQPVGIQAANFSNMCLEAADNIDVNAIINSYPDHALVPVPFWFPRGLMEQYGRCHVIQDFLRLLAICVEADVLTSSEAIEFCSEKVMFWGGGFGQLPLDVFITLGTRQGQMMRAINQAGFRCSKPDDGYQKRCISFFSERIGSLIMTKEFLRLGIMKRLDNGQIDINSQHLGYGCTVGQGAHRPERYEVGNH